MVGFIYFGKGVVLTMKSFKAWAIELNSGAFAGRYYFAYQNPIPKHMEGCIFALFDTRKEARKASKTTFYKSHVRRVAVQIRVMK